MNLNHRIAPDEAPSRRIVLGWMGGAALAGAGMLVSATPAHASPRVPKDLRPDGEFDRYVAGQAAQDQFSGGVLLAYRGRPVLRRWYGMAEKDPDVRNGPRTRFDLASVTKTCTAVAIAQLARRGKLSYHDTLDKHLDGYRSKAAKVTIAQLLSHTSGVGTPPTGTGPLPQTHSARQVWDLRAETVRGLEPEFTPGSGFSYSNDGYFILGEIVAAVSGKSYYDYIRDHIFAPARMTRSGFFTRPHVHAAADIANPYATQRSGGRANASAQATFPYVGTPDRGAYCTADDLLAYACALQDGTLLDRRSVKLITTGKVTLGAKEYQGLTYDSLSYGYGFQVGMVNGQRVVGHSGSGPGARNRLDIYPELGWVAIVLGNYDTPNTSIVEMQRQLITRMA
ncbi:serine hydrolase domain-containing protein [Nonomuraea ceibae]|uniref:serine hydrolase domain-containing protein n=1 Tax=Nonomuraea ceibae TaxID=1935170 RepID=UPI001C5E0E67|nr:serine hydrolase domain-containing protein [Nonomuraea ceibae]